METNIFFEAFVSFFVEYFKKSTRVPLDQAYSYIVCEYEHNKQDQTP